MPPDSNGETNSDGVKRISCDRLVAWALYKCGYTDQPECGLTTSAGGSPLMDYCKEKGWERIEDVNQVQAGDIVFQEQQMQTNLLQVIHLYVQVKT